MTTDRSKQPKNGLHLHLWRWCRAMGIKLLQPLYWIHTSKWKTDINGWSISGGFAALLSSKSPSSFPEKLHKLLLANLPEVPKVNWSKRPLCATPPTPLLVAFRPGDPNDNYTRPWRGSNELWEPPQINIPGQVVDLAAFIRSGKHGTWNGQQKRRRKALASLPSTGDGWGCIKSC